MSLDIWLETPIEAGQAAPEMCTLFHWNLTHNLGVMAAHVAVYGPLWHPGEQGYTQAHQLIEPLEAGLARLCMEKRSCIKIAPVNGWGTYDQLVACVSAYLVACRKYPKARISVSR